MTIRTLLSETMWQRLVPLLPPQKTRTGRRSLDHRRFLEALRRKRIVPVIPNRSDQPANPDFDREAYRECNLVERLVGKLKQFRRVATRYDKLDPHYVAFVQLASIAVWLRALAARFTPDCPAPASHPPR